jgi:glutamate racemase
MVDLIEPGTFLNDHDTCIDVCREVLDFYVKEKNIDVITLSSTHLPFLKKYIQELYPEIKLLDPAVDVSKDIKNYLEINNLLSAES